MKIMHLLKHDLADVRAKMAADYLRLRKENPAKARFLYSRIKRATDLTEHYLQANLIDASPR